MPKPTVIREWIEMPQTYLLTGPTKRSKFEAMVTINRCQLREKKDGKRYLIRELGFEFIRGETKEEMEENVTLFSMRENVRLLAKGIEANDFDTLPKRVDEPSEAEIDGTDDVYDFAEEPQQERTEP